MANFAGGYAKSFAKGQVIGLLLNGMTAAVNSVGKEQGSADTDGHKKQGSTNVGGDGHGSFGAAESASQNPNTPNLGKGESRGLTPGEIKLVEDEFGAGTIDVDKVNIRREKAWLFHRKGDAMAPDGDIYFHPDGNAYMDDFSTGKTLWSMKGALNSYKVNPSDIINGRKWKSFNIEQQAQIVRFHFYSKQGSYPTSWANKARPTTADYEKILPFIKP